MNIAGKNVFITGSTRGIGLAIAHAFAQQGANVVLNGRSDISEDTLLAFNAYGIKVLGLSGDVSLLEDCHRMVKEACDAFGSIDILINNAGITQDKILLKMTQEDFEYVLKVNLTGAFNMTQSVLKPMAKAKKGAIINISSVVGLCGNVGQANYAASKAGLLGLTKATAREMAGRNIRVNAIAPGLIESEMTDKLSTKRQEAMLERVPMKRIGTCQEVAQAVTFLAQQDYITGQVLAVDGGMSM